MVSFGVINIEPLDSTTRDVDSINAVFVCLNMLLFVSSVKNAYLYSHPPKLLEIYSEKD